MKVDRTKFAALCHPGADWPSFLEQFLNLAQFFEINNALDAANFWGQGLYETGGLHWLRETWGPTEEQKKYEPPNQLARNLGNTKAGDGYLYRGGGIFSTTGRYNYTVLAAKLNNPSIIANPDLIVEPFNAVMAALIFWKDHKLELLSEVDNETEVTRRINGGLTALSARKELTAKCKLIFLD